MAICPFSILMKVAVLYLSPMSLARKVVLFFFIGFFLTVNLSSGERNRPSVEEQILFSIEGRNYLLARKYLEAEVFFEKLVALWPDELLGYFGLMALYQIRNLENYDFRFDPYYKQWENRGRKLALKIVNAPDADAWDLLIAGGTLGVSGFYRAHNSKWFAALRDGSLGFHTMKKSFEKDERLVDGLLGVGLYDYWRSYFTRKLRFLPFFRDRRQEGREKIIRAIIESRFVSVLAEISLAFIDFQEKKYPQVLETTENLLKRYPQNTILRMLRGEAFFASKNYPEAGRVFEEILSMDSSLTRARLFLEKIKKLQKGD